MGALLWAVLGPLSTQNYYHSPKRTALHIRIEDNLAFLTNSNGSELVYGTLNESKMGYTSTSKRRSHKGRAQLRQLVLSNIVKGAKFLECRILVDRPKILIGRLENGKQSAVYLMIHQCPH